MKFIPKALIGASLLLGSTAFAGYIDTVEQKVHLDKDESHSYFHDLTDIDYWNIIGGDLSVDIYDDHDNRFEKIFLSFETAEVVVEEYDGDTGGLTTWWFSSDFSFDATLEAKALAALTSDGKLDISITSLWGDFYVGDSTLDVMIAVPEPASFGLMVLGIGGLVASRKRKPSHA